MRFLLSMFLICYLTPVAAAEDESSQQAGLITVCASVNSLEQFWELWKFGGYTEREAAEAVPECDRKSRSLYKIVKRVLHFTPGWMIWAFEVKDKNDEPPRYLFHRQQVTAIRGGQDI